MQNTLNPVHALSILKNLELENKVYFSVELYTYLIHAYALGIV
jgi:hypothetical protein